MERTGGMGYPAHPSRSQQGWVGTSSSSPHPGGASSSSEENVLHFPSPSSLPSFSSSSASPSEFASALHPVGSGRGGFPVLYSPSYVPSSFPPPFEVGSKQNYSSSTSFDAAEDEENDDERVSAKASVAVAGVHHEEFIKDVTEGMYRMEQKRKETLRQYHHRKGSAQQQRQDKRKEEGAKQELDYLGFVRADERLYFDKANNKVWVPHQNYIPVPVESLVGSLFELLALMDRDSGTTTMRPGDGASSSSPGLSHFRRFCGMYFYLILAKSNAAAAELQRYDTLFNPAVRNEACNVSSMREKFLRASAAQKRELCNRFVDSFIGTVRAANFNVLTQRELDFSDDSEQVFFGLPMKVDWDKLDTELLSDYFNSDLMQERVNEYGGRATQPVVDELPSFARHTLVFWRGAGVRKFSGYFWLQKIDFLLQGGLNFLKSLFGIGTIRTVGYQPAKTSRPDALRKSLVGEGGPMTTGVLPTSIHRPQAIKRITLADYPLLNLKTFFSRIELQEPTYKELVVLFRKRANASSSLPSSDSSPDGDGSCFAEDQLSNYKIHVQRFYDIPMKNVKLIFPIKQTGLNWADILYFLMLLSWVVTIAFKAFTAISRSTYLDEAVLGILFVMMPLLLRYINRKIASNRSSRLCSNMITNSLYNNSLNCNRSVLSYVKESAVEQDFKELVMTYFVIWKWKVGISREELDGACEYLLEKSFKVEVDFEVNDPLQKLLAAGLVVERNNGLYYTREESFVEDKLEEELIATAHQHFMLDTQQDILSASTPS
ncbi:Transmembrane protein [Balamuthia mandrillaris]